MRVIGIGNPLRGDDAIGLRVADRVRELAGPEVEVMQLEGEPARLIDAWQGAGLAVVVDAVKTGARGGEVVRFDATSDPLPAFVSAASTHALGLREAIELARALGRLPERLIVVGIEGVDFQAGAELSPAVEAAIDSSAAAVLDEHKPSKGSK